MKKWKKEVKHRFGFSPGTGYDCMRIAARWKKKGLGRARSMAEALRMCRNRTAIHHQRNGHVDARVKKLLLKASKGLIALDAILKSILK